MKDAVEIRLARHALRNDVPILGICRGSQMLNVIYGGSLFGDVRKEKQSELKHIDYEHYDEYRHLVRILPGTPLEQWYRRRELLVNSYHHQGVRRLGQHLKPMAYAEDGLVEAFYDPRHRFVVGLQFHPERMLEEYAGNLRVWRAFGAAVHHRNAAGDGIVANLHRKADSHPLNSHPNEADTARTAHRRRVHATRQKRVAASK